MSDDILFKINSLNQSVQKAEIEKSLILKQALSSSDPNAILKAQQYLTSIQSRDRSNDSKSLILDPQSLSGTGYKTKPIQLSYQILRNMARVPIIKAIIETRKEQVLDFTLPQKDKYSTGFIIRPKQVLPSDKQTKVSSKQQKEIEYLTEFILNCGDPGNEWSRDNFQSFTRKFIHDSLVLDQGTFEVVYNRRGIPTEFFATDGTTYRIAETFNEEENEKYKDKLQNDYLPHYVQVYQERIIAEFYPWELCFAIRNPQSDIHVNAYGRSELEDMIDTVTAMLNTDQYNANYFRVGANPKGILKVTGNINANRIEEFKTHWQAQMVGVRGAHKLPIIEADKMDFISTQASNKDMEYGRYQEYLIKVGCAMYKIDPSEIGFPMSGSSEAKPMFEGNNEARLKYSRDKGLKPLLTSFQAWVNKYVLGPKSNDQYELIFVGLDAESPQQELDNNIKAVQNWKTVNEIRRSEGLKDVFL